eukprot:6608300-Prymnesium_polylepis.1
MELRRELTAPNAAVAAPNQAPSVTNTLSHRGQRTLGWAGGGFCLAGHVTTVVRADVDDSTRLS